MGHLTFACTDEPHRTGEDRDFNIKEKNEVNQTARQLVDRYIRLGILFSTG